MELLRPDVYVEESQSPPGVPVVAVSTGAFLGVAERGPVDEAVLCDSFTTYWNTFGGYRSDSYLTYAVKGFFDNGGSRCYVVRAMNATAGAVADADAADFGGDATAYDINARWIGAYGNYIKYSTTKFETVLNGAIPAGARTTCVVDSVEGLERGDILFSSDGVDSITALIQSIDPSTKTITFAASVTAAAEIADDARVATPSQHRVITQNTVAIPTGSQTQMTLRNVASVRVGQILTISNGTTLKTVTVTGINGNDVMFASTDMTPGFAVDALVASQEFIMRASDQGIEAQPSTYLSPSSTNREDYVETRLKGDNDESDLIEVDMDSSSTGWSQVPKPVTWTALAGGTDGTAPGDADYVGTEVNGKGLHAFDKITDINFLSVPGVTTTTVQQGGVDYAAGTLRQDIEFISDAPSTSDECAEIRDWRLNTLNRDTSYASLYYPWIQVADPEVDGQNIYLPPSGHVMGV